MDHKKIPINRAPKASLLNAHNALFEGAEKHQTVFLSHPQRQSSNRGAVETFPNARLMTFQMLPGIFPEAFHSLDLEGISWWAIRVWN